MTLLDLNHIFMHILINLGACYLCGGHHMLTEPPRGNCSSEVSVKIEGFKPVQLSYNIYEPDTGADEKLAPIIYLHGIFAVKEHWLDIPQKVADVTKRKSYSVDARNHGDSEWSDHFNFELNVEDFFHFLETLGIRKAVLVGHSMGGITAIKAALQKPDRVERIIVEDIYVRKLPRNVFENLLTCMKLLNSTLANAPTGLGDDETIDIVIQQMMVEKTSPELVAFMEQMGNMEKSPHVKISFKRNDEGRLTTKYNEEVIAKSLASYETLSLEPEGIFDGPALFIDGTLSPFKVSDEEEHIKQFFPNAVLVAIEESHDIHFNRPEEFTDLILEFISLSIKN